jgi:hypothetical protein
VSGNSHFSVAYDKNWSIMTSEWLVFNAINQITIGVVMRKLMIGMVSVAAVLAAGVVGVTKLPRIDMQVAGISEVTKLPRVNGVTKLPRVDMQVAGISEVTKLPRVSGVTKLPRVA